MSRFVALLSWAMLLLCPPVLLAQADNRHVGKVSIHDAKITSGGFDSRTKFIVIGLSTGTMTVMEYIPNKFQRLIPWSGHVKGITATGFTKDDALVVTGAEDGSVKFWDTQRCVKFTRDSQEKKEGAPTPIAPQPKLVIRAHNDAVTAIAFHPEGKLMATSSLDGTVKIWTVATGKLVATIPAHKGGVNSIAYDKLGEKLVSGGADRIVKVWKTTSLTKPIHIFTAHDGPVNGVAISPDGKRVAAASGAAKKEGQLKIWDLETNKEAFSLAGHSDTVMSVSFHPTLQRLASGSKDKSIRVWDLENKKELYQDLHPDGLRRVDFSGDGKLLFTFSPDIGNWWAVPMN